MTKKTKIFFVLLVLVTVISYVLAAILLDRFEIRAGLLWLIPDGALLVWSIILYRKNRCWALSGVVITIVVLMLGIKLPDYHEYKKRQLKQTAAQVQMPHDEYKGNRKI